METFLGLLIPFAGTALEPLGTLLTILAALHKLTFNRRAAKENAPVITFSYFRSCSDEQSDAYGTGGTIESITGICSRVDTQVTFTITTGGACHPP